MEAIKEEIMVLDLTEEMTLNSVEWK